MNGKTLRQLSISATLLSALFVLDVGAVPVNLDNPFIFRDNRGGPAVSPASTGDFLQIDVGNLPTSVPLGTTATAKNLLTNQVFPLTPCHDVRDRCAFFGLIPYTVNNANADWEVTAINDLDSDMLIISAYGTGPGSGQLPFLENVQSIGTGPYNNKTPD